MNFSMVASLFEGQRGTNYVVFLSMLYCRYVVWSMRAKTLKMSFVSVMLRKDVTVAWIRNMKRLLVLCLTCLSSLDPASSTDDRQLTVYLHVLVTFTSTTSWAFKDDSAAAPLLPGMQRLCDTFLGHLVQKDLYVKLRTVLVKGTCSSTGVSLKPAALMAVLSLALRPLASSSCSKTVLAPFVTNVLSVPLIVQHIQSMAPQVMTTTYVSLFGRMIGEFIRSVKT